MLKLGSHAQTVRVSSPSAVVSAAVESAVDSAVDSAGVLSAVEVASLVALPPQPTSSDAAIAAAISAAAFFFFMDFSSLKMFLYSLVV